MAFKASNILPEQAYNTLKRTAVQLKINLQSFNTNLENNNVDFKLIKAIYLTINNAKNQLDALSQTPGIIEYAKVQEDDQGYNVAAEFIDLIEKMQSALTWVSNNVPSTVTLKVPNAWGSPNDTIVSNTFTPAQTAGLRTVLTTIITAIE